MPFLGIFSVTTAIIFLIGDAIMIPLVMRPLFLSALGPAVLEELRLVPAVLFYLIHIFGLVWFVGRTCRSDSRPSGAVVNGAILGLVAYSCYEMTSWTIMRDWHIGLVVTDIVWGTLISGVSALAGAIAAGRWGAKSAIEK